MPGLALRPFAIGRTPVTNAEYAVFLASGWEPPAAEGRVNFLHHWGGARAPVGLILRLRRLKSSAAHGL